MIKRYTNVRVLYFTSTINIEKHAVTSEQKVILTSDLVEILTIEVS